jgi:hypothetical protein
MMKKAELELLDSQLAGASHYLEFGAGNSTLRALRFAGIRRVDSVDSSPEYVERKLLSNPSVDRALTDGRLRVHLADIGEVRGWGFPKNSAKRHLWPNYSRGIFEKSSRHDLVLVDGRFRVACTLRSILHTPADTRIMIHDFWRRRYHVVLPFLKQTDRRHSLVVFEKRQDADSKAIESLLTRYEYSPGDRKTRVANWMDGRWSYLAALNPMALATSEQD